MRKMIFVLVAVAMVAPLAVAELQNVEVGGSLRIRGNWYFNEVNAWDDSVGNDIKFVEQRTRLNVKADFTDSVCAFIELDSYDTWGQDFRSNYITGVDRAAATADDVEVYQSYVQADEMWGQPLSLRVGRQELALGSQWLVGVNDTSSLYTGLSFDGVRLTYATDMVSIDAFTAKLAELSPLEQDGDVDLYGVYGSYLGVEDMTFDAYWLFVRDARGLVPLCPLKDWDVTTLHTIGLRAAGNVAAFDFEAEVAYQFGNADRLGPLTTANVFERWDGTDVDAFGGNAEVGYTFDMQMTPRLFVGAAYLEGAEDDALAFNRLFSNWEYSEFLDATELSNAWVFRAGASAMPTENVELMLCGAYMLPEEALETRVHFWPWETEDLDDELGWELGLYGTYNYSEDLTFEAGWSHFFTGEGVSKDNFHRFIGNYVVNNGFATAVGTDDDDADYLFLQTKICF
ncbi:MAG TPA: alginate export family protein [Candidatus Hydrogenedentes bacterium]|nr:alginate export family protein [Candidatus Hydrogenedentota bacterium]